MAQAIPFLLKAGLQIALAAAIQAATTALFGKKTPGPESGKIPLKQPQPPQIFAFGECRLAGFYALYVSVTPPAGVYPASFPNNHSRTPRTIDVLMLCKGPIDSFVGFYFNDDYLAQVNTGATMTVSNAGTVVGLPASEDGRYHYADYPSAAPIKLEWRLGAVPETAYTLVVGAVNDTAVWSTAHRGDGTASMALHCGMVKAADMATVYPNGEIKPSARGKWAKVWDWRVSGCELDDPTTWVWSKNAVVLQVHDDIVNQNASYAWRYEPTLAELTVAADICDEDVTSAAGTFKRYEASGFYNLDNPPQDVTAKWLACYDGLLIERGDGAYLVFAGKYYEPTVTLTEDQILEFSWRRDRRDEDVVNKLVVSFNSPAHAFTMTETLPYFDAVDLGARGAEKAKAFALEWVTENDQARRLAKRAMSRLSAAHAGHVVVKLSESEGEIEQRFLRVKNHLAPASMWDVVVEVTGVSIDSSTDRATITFVEADPDVDDWASDDGGPVPADPAALNALLLPVIDLITVFEENHGLTTGIRLRVYIENPQRADYLVIVSWRPPGQVAWCDEPAQPPLTSVGTFVTSGFVPAVAALEVRLASVTPAGQGPWTDSQFVNGAYPGDYDSGMLTGESSGFSGGISGGGGGGVPDGDLIVTAYGAGPFSPVYSGEKEGGDPLYWQSGADCYVSGGLVPYAYSWAVTSGSAFISDATAVTITLTSFDGSGCELVCTVTDDLGTVVASNAVVIGSA